MLFAAMEISRLAAFWLALPDMHSGIAHIVCHILSECDEIQFESGRGQKTWTSILLGQNGLSAVVYSVL